MDNTTRKHLAEVAGKAAQIPFHGDMEGKESNLEPIIRFFPNWTLREADGLWCAAFVYYCCREAGFEIPIMPDECKTCHLAGCISWEEFATGDPQVTYYKGTEGFVPEAGDIVLYDRIFENREHDHIGIVIENRGGTILAAEGNIDNRSGIIERPKDGHIRGYIRIPDGYKYGRKIMDYQTENMILHFVTEDDLSEVARTWPADHHPLSDAEALEAIASMRRNYERNVKGRICHLCLAVCGKDHPGTIMGWCGLDGSRHPEEPEIFILLDEPYRGKGYGTACVKELLRIAVEDYALSGVHGGCDKDNIASARAMKKGGMVQYGTEENGDPLFRFCANNISSHEETSVNNSHVKYMKRCYELAISAGKKGHDTFGAVLVHNGEILEEAENTADYAHRIFGHAEFNLVHKCANKYSDEILEKSIVYTSCAPCERCLAAIASLGVHQVVCGVSYKEFCRLLPFDYQAVDREGLLRQLGIQMTLTESVLEEEGMHVFEWWGGEYHPLEELIAEMDEAKKQQR